DADACNLEVDATASGELVYVNPLVPQLSLEKEEKVGFVHMLMYMTSVPIDGLEEGLVYPFNPN
ncbi:hypothetical protein L0F63_007065, partial [Massospora cicadina]